MPRKPNYEFEKRRKQEERKKKKEAKRQESASRRAMDQEFSLEESGLEIFCPKCGNEMVHDANSLALAESRRGAMLECGACKEISQWEFTLEPRVLKQIPIGWGGQV